MKEFASRQPYQRLWACSDALNLKNNVVELLMPTTVLVSISSCYWRLGSTGRADGGSPAIPPVHRQVMHMGVHVVVQHECSQQPEKGTPTPCRLFACYMQECQRLGRACCEALKVLHAAGITHTDIREENTVWLGDDDAMLIDLEQCRFESSDLPDGMRLCGWDSCTLDDGNRYTYSSDMYSVGLMLQRLLTRLPSRASAAAEDFTHKLIAKELSAEEALSHEWLSSI